MSFIPIRDCAPPSPDVQNQYYSGMFVRDSRSTSPAPVQILKVREDVTVRTSPTHQSAANQHHLRPQFSAGDYILALHPQDDRNRYFVGEIGEKTRKEALEHLNSIKIFWIAQDGARIQDYLVQHDRKTPIMQRILPIRDPEMLKRCIISQFILPDIKSKLVGHHLL